ncbi:hypothetical protein [Deinococcus sp. PEB2-67]
MPRTKTKGETPAETFPTGEIPQVRIDQAVQHEFSVLPIDDRRLWSPKAGYTFSIPGPVAVLVSDGDYSHEIDDLIFHIEIGGLTLTTGFAGAEGIAFTVLSHLYGADWARVMMALCSRCPVDFEDRDLPVPERAIQALWAAAHSYEDQWPARTAGFDDCIWGVQPPEGVTPAQPIQRKARKVTP